jgi:hypothetical protein
MASFITISSDSPSVAVFGVFIDGLSDLKFKKSGATGDDKDLSALGPGPLKEYLSRLANWSTVAVPQDPSAGGRVRWRCLSSVSGANTPVVATTLAQALQLLPTGTTEITFHNSINGPLSCVLELAFIHSLTR